MARFARSSLLMLLLVVTATACAGPSSSSSSAQGPRTMVPVADVKAIAGTWTGIAARSAGSGREDWLELTVNENGTFKASAARQTGALVGDGTLQVNDGKVLAVGRNGRAVLTLYERSGPLLVMDFTDTDGIKYSAELRRKS